MTGGFYLIAPYDIFEKNKHNAVPIIACANLGELTGPGYVHVPEMVPGYVKLLNAANRGGVKGYAAIFDQVPGNFRKEGGVSAHAMELHFVFGDVDDPLPWERLRYMYQAAGAKSPMPVITDADRKVSEAMMQMWTAFARTGNPSIPGAVDWPAWDEAKDQYLYITEKPEVRSGFSKVGQK